MHSGVLAEVAAAGIKSENETTMREDSDVCASLCCPREVLGEHPTSFESGWSSGLPFKEELLSMRTFRPQSQIWVLNQH